MSYSYGTQSNVDNYQSTSTGSGWTTYEVEKPASISTTSNGWTTYECKNTPPEPDVEEVVENILVHAREIKKELIYKRREVRYGSMFYGSETRRVPRKQKCITAIHILKQTPKPTPKLRKMMKESLAKINNVVRPSPKVLNARAKEYQPGKPMVAPAELVPLFLDAPIQKPVGNFCNEQSMKSTSPTRVSPKSTSSGLSNPSSQQGSQSSNISNSNYSASSSHPRTAINTPAHSTYSSASTSYSGASTNKYPSSLQPRAATPAHSTYSSASTSYSGASSNVSSNWHNPQHHSYESYHSNHWDHNTMQPLEPNVAQSYYGHTYDKDHYSPYENNYYDNDRYQNYEEDYYPKRNRNFRNYEPNYRRKHLNDYPNRRKHLNDHCRKRFQGEREPLHKSYGALKKEPQTFGRSLVQRHLRNR